MHITLNGKNHALEEACTLPALLAQLDMADKPIVAELNGKALSPTDHASTTLADGDRLELIVIAAGG